MLLLFPLPAFPIWTVGVPAMTHDCSGCTTALSTVATARGPIHAKPWGPKTRAEDQRILRRYTWVWKAAGPWLKSAPLKEIAYCEYASQWSQLLIHLTGPPSTHMQETGFQVTPLLWPLCLQLPSPTFFASYITSNIALLCVHRSEMLAYDSLFYDITLLWVRIWPWLFLSISGASLREPTSVCVV